MYKSEHLRLDDQHHNLERARREFDEKNVIRKK